MTRSVIGRTDPAPPCRTGRSVGCRHRFVDLSLRRSDGEQAERNLRGRPLACSLPIRLHPVTMAAARTVLFAIHHVHAPFCVATVSPVASLSVSLSLCPRYGYYAVKNIRISTDILWPVFHSLTEPVPFAFLSVNRRNDEARAHAR